MLVKHNCHDIHGDCAEGVETEEQLEWLRGAGFDYAQGYYVGQPLTSEQLKAYLLETCGLSWIHR